MKSVVKFSKQYVDMAIVAAIDDIYLPKKWKIFFSNNQPKKCKTQKTL